MKREYSSLKKAKAHKRFTAANELKQGWRYKKNVNVEVGKHNDNGWIDN